MTCTVLSNGAESKYKCNEGIEPILSIKSNLIDFLCTLINKGYTDFYLSSEYGIPLWSAEIISEMKRYKNISLHLAVPENAKGISRKKEVSERIEKIEKYCDSLLEINDEVDLNGTSDIEKYLVEHSQTVFIFGRITNRLKAADYAGLLDVSVEYMNFI